MESIPSNHPPLPTKDEYAEILAEREQRLKQQPANPRKSKINSEDESNYAWMDEGQCLNNYELFMSQGRESSGQREEREDKAKALCGKCAVRLVCLERALAHSNDEDIGIWGGTNEKERRIMRAKLKRSRTIDLA